MLSAYFDIVMCRVVECVTNVASEGSRDALTVVYVVSDGYWSVSYGVAGDFVIGITARAYDLGIADCFDESGCCAVRVSSDVGVDCASVSCLLVRNVCPRT